MKKLFTITSAVAIIFLCSISLYAQTAASVNWPLVSGRQPVITGNVVSDSITTVGGLTVKAYPTNVLVGPLGAAQSQWCLKDPNGTQINWPLNNTDNICPGVYFDFIVSPKPGFTLTIDSVKGWIGGMGASTMRANIFYGGTDTSYATLTQLNSAVFQLHQLSNNPPGNMDTAYAHYIGLEIQDGQKFRFRIYPWYKSASASSSKYLLMQNVTISGSTVAATAVNDKNEIPANFELKQNYPNPFNPTTSISYSIPKTEFVTLKVYNLIGQEVANLVSGIKEPGTYKSTFDASKLSSGIYFYRLEAGNFVSIKKMALMK